MGIVYLLHFDRPLGGDKHQAIHYVGFSKNKRTLGLRIEHHRKGHAGCSITNALKEHGIGFTLAKIFEGVERTFERKLKNTKKVAPYCPICNPDTAREYKPKEG